MKQPPRDSADDGLRRAYRDLQSPGGPGCPAPEVLTALALNDDLGPERDALADHVVSCRRCSEDYQLLSRTHAEATRSGGPRLSRRAVLSAAVVAVALAAGLLVLGRRPPDTEVVRGGKPTEAVEPVRGATLAEPPGRLAWPADPEASGYRVSLFDSTGELLWKSDPITTPAAELPAPTKERLKPGAYYWSVSVERPLGTRRLGPFPFTVARPR